MTSAEQSDEDSRPPGTVGTEWLSQQSEYGEAGEDQHRTHTTQIGVHATLLNEELGQITTTDREQRHDGIERKDEGDTHGRVGGVTILVREVGRRPEEEEPPHTIRHELTHDERPGLSVGETLEERDSLLLLFLSTTVLTLCQIHILLNIVEFCLIHALILAGFVIQPYPQAHPHITQHTDDDESHLPAPRTSQQGNRGRCSQRTNRCATVEDRGGESTILGREILRRSLDGCREVTCLTDGKNQTAREEEPYRDGGDGHGSVGACLYQSQGLDAGITLDVHRHPATAGMQDCTR